MAWPGQNTQDNSSWPPQLGLAHQTHCFLRSLYLKWVKANLLVVAHVWNTDNTGYRQSAYENFKFSKCGKGTVKLKDILCDAFITLPSITINNDTITISEIDYCKILPSVRQDYDLFEDEFEVPEMDEFAYTNCDEQSTQDSDEDDTRADQQMQINMALGTRTRSRRAPPRFDDFIA